MKTYRFVMFALICAGFFSVCAVLAGEKRASREDVVKIIDEAVAFAKEHGKEALLEEISKGREGKFIRGELYVSAYDFDIKVLAHAAKPKLAGKDFSKLKDKKGKKIGEAYVNAIKDGTHWIEYYWQNPVSKKIEKKLGYGMKLDDTCWISSGTYAEE